MIGKITKALDLILAEINKNIYSNLEDYCFIDSIADNTTFIGEDGSLATVIKIKGINKTITSDEAMLDTVDDIYSDVKGFFKDNGHMLQVYFSRSPETSDVLLNKHYNVFRENSKKMGFDLDFYFEDKVNKLKNFIIHEECVMVLWSRPKLLKNLKQDGEEIKESMKNSPLTEKAQDTHLLYKSLLVKHQTFCDSIVKTFKGSGIYTEVLSIKTASNLVKSTCEFDRVGENWSPRVHLDNIEENHKNIPLMTDRKDERVKEEDISYFLYPKLKRQFVPSLIEKIDLTTLKINSNYVKIFKVEIPQEIETKFYDFLQKIDDSIPFQISFKIESGGLNNIGIKNLLATLLTFDKTTDNNLIKDSIKYYLDIEKKAGVVFTKNSISVTVWADNMGELNKRASTVSTTIQSWGNQTVIDEIGDLYGGLFNSLPLYTPKIPNDANFILPLRDLIYMLPLSRPLNIEENGLITYRTEDKKMINYDPMSSLLNYFNELIVATPGSGKSVKSNSNNLSFLLKPKSNKFLEKLIPLLFIIDIGPSSKGMIEFLRSIAPAKMKNAFVYKKIENSLDFTVNMLDTPLGCRALPEKLKSLVISFLIMLTTPVGKESMDEGMVSRLLQKTYKAFSDKGASKKIYEPRQSLEIDEAIKKHKISFIENKTSWWELVDAFFEKDEIELARLAQSFAVPNLIDLISILKSDDDLKETYNKVKIGGGNSTETLPDLFVRLLTQSLDLYPIFNGRTLLNLGDARVVSFDLNDVAPDGKGDEVAAKQSALMYTFSTIYGLRNFFFEDSTSKYAPAKYKEYIDNQYKEYRTIPKRFVVDEFHRGAQVPKFRAEIVRMLRESRKWNISNCLISQYLDDFSGEIKELCSAKFILSSGENYRKVQNTFDLSDDIAQILRTKLTGPSSVGVPFVVDFTTKQGKFTQYLYSTLSGMELWANTSTTEDVEMYLKMSDVFDAKKSLQILSKEYPGGSIKSILDKDKTNTLSVDYLVDKIKVKYINL